LLNKPINEGGNIIMNSRITNLLGGSLVLCLVIGLTLIPVSNVDAYYGGYTGGYGYSPYSSGYGYAGYASPYYPSAYSSFGSLGTGLGYTSGLYGGYCGLYGSSLYGGLYGGLSSGLGLYGGYGGLMGGLYGGLMGGLMGGLYGGASSMYSPFGAQNLYYPVSTTGGLTYQVPFMQIAPMLGIAGLYNQLFPNLFNPQPAAAPIVNVSTPSTQFVSFPTPISVVSIT
jgi:hypothetical protein